MSSNICWWDRNAVP